MKKKVNKLSLTKVTMANLNDAEMNIMGGAPTDFCTIYQPRCWGTRRDCDVTLDPGACSYGCPTRPDTQCQ